MYSIAEASILSGVSRDMIRHYEKIKLIKPNRNPENNYRTYTYNDICLITLIRMYNGFGIPLKECRKMLWGEYIDNGCKQMQYKIDLLKKEQLLLQSRIEFSQSLCRCLEAYVSGQFSFLADRSSILLIPRFDDGYRLNLLEYEPELNRVFQYYYRIQKTDLTHPGNPYPHDVGIMIPTPMEHSISDTVVISRSLVHHCWLELPYGNSITHTDLQPLFDDLLHQNLSIDGDIICYQILESAKENKDNVVLCLETPVRYGTD